MNLLMIRSAKISQIPDIVALTRKCAAHMIHKGIYQWNEHYPSREAFENDLAREELFVLELENKVKGCIVVSTFMDEVYKPVRWLGPNKNNLYIHRLAVDPELQGQGYARRLMDFAETRARDGGYDSVRLDTFSQNQRNQRFYETRGYRKLEDIFFPNQSEHPFHCYELLL